MDIVDTGFLTAPLAMNKVIELKLVNAHAIESGI